MLDLTSLMAVTTALVLGMRPAFPVEDGSVSSMTEPVIPLVVSKVTVAAPVPFPIVSVVSLALEPVSMKFPIASATAFSDATFVSTAPSSGMTVEMSVFKTTLSAVGIFPVQTEYYLYRFQ